MRAAFCWLLLLFSIVATPAVAERRVALIVANGAYAKAALPNPSVDAVMVKQALVELDFEVVVVSDASLEAFDAAISAFALRARGADLALFYYAGHGKGMVREGGGAWRYKRDEHTRYPS